jgi:hypothetical protein
VPYVLTKFSATTAYFLLTIATPITSPVITIASDPMKSPFKDLPREVAVLSSVAFLVAVGFGVIAPAIPLFARSFGVSQAAAGSAPSQQLDSLRD